MRKTSGRLEMVRDLLAKMGVRPSHPRIRVLDYLLRSKTHPTADEVFSNLVQEIPTLSKTTVYNALNLLVESGLAVTVHVEGHETRYDGNVVHHGHFKCWNCGKVYDFGLTPGLVCETGLEGFRIEKREVNLWGVCAECVRTEEDTAEDEKNRGGPEHE